MIITIVTTTTIVTAMVPISTHTKFFKQVLYSSVVVVSDFAKM